MTFNKLLIFKVTRKSISQTCSYTYQCVVNANLICSGGYCVCKNGYANNAGTCSTIKKISLKIKYDILI